MGDAKLELGHVGSVLFVCLGNICRSPLAQGVFEELATRRGVRERLVIESRGTGGWHVGQKPDPRAIAVARKNGIELRSLGKQLDPRDFAAFDLLLAMDATNLGNILSLGCEPTRARLFLSFAKGREGLSGLDVPDPYYGGPEGFDHVYTLIQDAAEGLLDAIVGARR